MPRRCIVRTPVRGTVCPATAIVPAATSIADTPAGRMRKKLQSPTGHDLYKMRKAIVEPVFGQLKEVRGFRRFLLRGLEQVGAEFDLMALTHNLLKLFRYASAQPIAAYAM